MSLSPAVTLARACRFLIAGVTLCALVACAERTPLPTDPTGKLFARGLDEITDLYITPVSEHRLVLSGAERLSRLDPKLLVVETPGFGNGSVLALNYGGTQIATFALPADDDPHAWGELMANLIAAAKAASPVIAVATEDQIDKVVFDGITGALDRFSRYSAPETARDLRAARDGFGGIGITLDVTNEQFRVTAVTPQGPADRAGVKPEDRLVAIDGVATAGRKQADVIHQLRGPLFSTVEVAVTRPGSTATRRFRLQRALIIVPTVTSSHHGDIAIVHVASFNQNTTERIADALAETQRQMGGRIGGIILDLRDNPGGLLDQAVSLSDLFIHDGPIVSTVGRHPASHQFFSATGDSIAPRTPIVVLINGGSASASEIVAAALQDVGRAVVVGSASYGKGTVQTVMRLPNDGELTLTWARLVTPTGYILNVHGVVPTVCTSDLGDDEGAVQTALSRARAVAAPSPLTPRPRASLDEADWSALRQSCPARHGERDIDLKVAERVLDDPALYSAAVYEIPAATNLAARPDPAAVAAYGAEPGLTGADPSLSSEPHNP